MKKGILHVILSIAMVIVSASPAFAAENAQALSDPAITTMQAAVETVSSESNDNTGITPRARDYVDATIAAGQLKIYQTTVYKGNRGGFVLGVQASSGPSYYGVYNRDTNVFYPLVYNTSGSTYRGTLYVPESGYYSVAIQNISSKSIKYSGFYDY